MRLQQFSLDLFGHFSNKTFDFGKTKAGSSDFHLIYGPNEAGKTTAMEAFMRLIYGFPHREPYDFMHQRKNLRVSGILEIDVKPLQLSRLPVRTGSLRDQNETVLPEAALLTHLGGLSEQDYRQLFCLDDETGTRNEFRLTCLTAYLRRSGALPGNKIEIAKKELGQIYQIRHLSMNEADAPSLPKRIVLKGWRRVH